MGNYRTELLYPAKDLGEAGTESIDIDLTEVISRLEITYKTTKGSSGQSYGSPKNIPKIELVDGSKPLHSLTGYTSQALAHYNRPGVMLNHGQHTNGNSETDVYPIDFGRFLYDPLLAFDPKKFTKPQLKITYDEDASDTSADAGTLEIWAELFDEKPVTPMGFLSARQVWYGNFLANNSVNEFKLEDDEVMRQLLVRANYAGYEPWYQVDIAKLEEVSGGRVIFDYPDLEMYYRRMKSRWPQIVYTCQLHASSSGVTFYLPPSQYYAQMVGVQTSGTGDPYTVVGTSRGGKLTMMAASSIDVDAVVTGHLPWHTIQFPFGDQQDPEDWYDPAGKKPRLRLTSNTAGVSGDGEVIIETVHKY